MEKIELFSIRLVCHHISLKKCILIIFVDSAQVQVIHKYVAKQADELSLEESDVINVFKKISDGNVIYLGDQV